MLLLDEKSITNEIMLREDLVGIVRGTSIEIVKNTMTKDTGMVPFAQYIRIANSRGPVSYESLFEPKKEDTSFESQAKAKQASEEEEIKEAVEGFLKDVFGLVKEVGEGIQTEVETMQKDVTEDIDKFKENVKPDIQRAVRGLSNLLKKAEVEADILRLQGVKKFAEQEDISTKGFVKKVDAKIAVLKASIEG
jgi:gas vesicle protein